MRARHALTLAVATVAVLAGAAAPAAADTDYNTTGLTYNCTFPAAAPQPVTVAARFTGPDVVASGGTIAVGDLSGGIAVSPELYQVLILALGYDAVRGSGTLPLAATNALPATANLGVVIPEVFWDAVSRG